MECSAPIVELTRGQEDSRKNHRMKLSLAIIIMNAIIYFNTTPSLLGLFIFISMYFIGFAMATRSLFKDDLL